MFIPRNAYSSPERTSLEGRPLRLIVSAIVLTGLFLSCQTGPVRQPSDRPLKHRPKPALSAGHLEKRIHALINRERAKHGLSALAWDDALAGIARGHSRDMGSRGYFSHDSPEGRDFEHRYRQARYSCAVRTGNTIHMGAENIFMNVRYGSVTTVNGEAFYDWNSGERIAETTVQGWMDSPGHRKNILTPHWRNQGIGVFFSTDDKIFITQNFC